MGNIAAKYNLEANVHLAISIIIIIIFFFFFVNTRNLKAYAMFGKTKSDLFGHCSHYDEKTSKCVTPYKVKMYIHVSRGSRETSPSPLCLSSSS